MLAVGNGDLWLLSTPFGKRGFFCEDWVWFTAPATECSRIEEKFLEEERRQMGDLWFRQEYMCGFVDESHQMFGRDWLWRRLMTWSRCGSRGQTEGDLCFLFDWIWAAAGF
jgi:hypothetical protein